MLKALDNGINLEYSIQVLDSLPYRKGKYAARNWGHIFHSMLSYPSKLKPSIAYFLVKLFTKEGEKVLDPFSGVGTITFEACAQGRFGIGSDISPLAYHATNAKVNPPTIEEVDNQLEFLDKYIEENRSREITEIEEEIVPFYHPETLKEILLAKEYFSLYQADNLSFLLTCLLHILHGNRPYALSRRSHNIIPWPPKGPYIYKPVIKLLREKAYRMLGSGLPLTFLKGQALNDSVFRLQLEDNSIDCILTSPPFHDNRDFLRMNRIRLWFCGWDYKFQKQMKSTFLEKRKNITGYDSTFKEFNRVLKPNSLCIMHLGVVKIFDMANEIMPYAEKYGFERIKVIYEDTSKLESHGIIDRGATQKHQYLILKNSKKY